jgi:hypothetical protein
MDNHGDDDGDRPNGFLARWARRKEQVRSGVPVPAGPPPVVVTPPQAVPVPAVAQQVPHGVPVEPPPQPALPTLDDVAVLTPESDYARFVAPGVDSGVRNAAMKKLFTDPHFNLMDGLDTYIDDYGKPDPIPPGMLRQMYQSKSLRLFDHEDEDGEGRIAADPAAAPLAAEAPSPALQADALSATATPEPGPTADDHPDLQLQPDDAAGPGGAGEGTAG